MLAHKAEDEGIAVAENIARQTGIVNHDVIPSVVFTMPEIAALRLIDEEVKQRVEVTVGKLLMIANSNDTINHDPHAFVNLAADARTPRDHGVPFSPPLTQH